MRKFLVIAVVLALAALAAAQVPTSGNVFFGYSYYNTDLSSIDRANANGWAASLEGKVFPHVGIVSDFSDHYGSQNFVIVCPQVCPGFNTDVNVRNLLFGPRVSASVGRFRPFAEAMFGLGHVNARNFGSDTSFSTAVGGGLDYKVVGPISWRFEGDYVQTRFFGTHQNNVRIATGIAFHF